MQIDQIKKIIKNLIKYFKYKYRNIIIQIEDDQGSYKVVGAPVRFSETATGGKRFVAGIGEHTVSVLQEELSMTTQEIKRLIENGIIFVRKDS